MSIQAVAWALDQEIPARPKLVLVAVANHADHTNGYCWLKASTIAREASCGQRSVWRYLGALIRNGYVRKEKKISDDGRQRANDYWIMFGRPQKVWSWGGDGRDDDPDIDPYEEATDLPDIDQPCARESLGPEVKNGLGRAVEKPRVAHGPCDSVGTPIESAEPSKSKSKEKESESSGAPKKSGLLSGPPRTYRPPPPEPQGATGHDHGRKHVFVFEGSKAWNAWVEYKLRVEHRRWALATDSVINGVRRRGWNFPTLFPPDCKSAADKADHEFIAQNGGL